MQNTAYHAPMPSFGPVRHPSDIEAELESWREYARQVPDMRAYAESKREALRVELRAARKAAYRAPVRPSFIRRLFGALHFSR